MARKHLWIGALLPLALGTGWAAEPAPDAASIESALPAPPGFDLRGESVRKLVRATAATQMNPEHLVEAEKPKDTEANLAAALRHIRPVAEETAAPRLPDRPPRCDGFFTCGIETLLGLGDFDDELYGRVERNRLMNQGSFTNSSKINASIPLPRPPGDSGPLRPE